ncbi:hypothetical protein N7541_004349 [Penicillium brevicompactum]|uniref:Cytochrome c oxidase assembly protein COX19 n=1 Tax=Penicillium brevicompactum TaxID=5074 RepID=A0A9W9UWB8_PENBR|nr:hypothetical protein N7541_004349 [Penicillium brevicompactum]
MSFGAPGGGSVNYKPTPPERGSFPLDHEGECKHIISGYLKCIKLNRGTNDEACRKLAKDYLACRMDNQYWRNELLIASLQPRNLMAPDSFDNLGLVFKGDEGKDQNSAPPAANMNQTETKK